MSESSNTTGQQGGQQPQPSTPKDAAAAAGPGSRRI